MQGIESHVPYRRFGLIAPGAHDAVADGVNAGSGFPVPNQPPHLGPARMVLERRRIQHPQQQLLPPRDKDCAVIELHSQHVSRLRRPLQAPQVIANLPGARAQIVFRSQRGNVSTNRLFLRQVGSHARVSRPQAPRGRVERLRVRSCIRPARPAGGTAGTLIDGNAPEDRPADVAVAIADDGVLVRNADLRRHGERLPDRAHPFQLDEIEIGGLRRLRQPGAEPALAAVWVSLQQHTGCSGLHCEVDIRLASDTNLFHLHRQRHGAGTSLQRRRLHGCARYRCDVQPLSIAVGEPPGDVAVRSGDEQRRSRQSDAR